MQILIKYKSVRTILLLALWATFLAVQISPREYQIKAAFLFNFTQFVEWPSQHIPAKQPIVIGILGKDPFGEYLEDIIAGESIDGHPLVIKRFSNIDDIKCQVLFININDTNRLRAALNRLKGNGILTVSDVSGFTKAGGMIRLYKKNDKINIQINLEEAKAEKLVISPKLLKLAEIVKTAH